jgi:cell filamentation protein
MATDPYLYPGTNTLRNLAGTKDAEELRRFESVFTTSRISQLLLEPIEGDFNVPHLRRLHHYIFQDVYDWAGSLELWILARKVNFGSVVLNS